MNQFESTRSFMSREAKAKAKYIATRLGVPVRFVYAAMMDVAVDQVDRFESLSSKVGEKARSIQAHVQSQEGK
jgi:hypothetical protein